jgi:hypothetical protein
MEQTEKVNNNSFFEHAFPLYFRIKRKCEDKIINTLLVILVYQVTNK